jgi:predicted SAM-dependent methyltransferase
MNNIKYLHIKENSFIPVGSSFDHIVNIDTYENNSIENCMIQDLLDYYTDHEASLVLSLIYKKLKPGGKVVIQAPDLKQIAVAITFNEIDQKTIKEILYPDKKSIHSINDICNMILANKMHINSKKYVNIIEYYIECQKNEQ